ncbi:MAG TPA: iron-containing alcohol dehydrogenase [Halanaerobiaceae bacterium]|jgi:alcohol dehydrogenase YqhD (iron-dependent ADH family)|nr:iron-containing alcohol dehydrogenase [Bacillota bacterium]HHU92445.1 iron-containing alcohol dehydrogenase [Halanaerobiaceae bacterium]HPZ62737.1 iron-containing alcohol dehydrogenase [Halanaerobiales bacterium]HQD04052.1 iron-containing alcohol dehydrogenase [Halanaerobiales bacterium]
MENFEFYSPTRIIFGRGTEEKAGELAREYGKKVLLHYGGGSIKKYGLYDRVVQSLREAGVDFMELGGVEPNPRLGLVQEGIRICRENNIDFILAVGGGSVIDSAKAISLGVPYQGDVWDFFMGKALPEKNLPVGVVLTIPAAGSEASNSVVITKEEGLLKRSCNNDINRPVFAIMNPEISFTLPPYQTASGIVDMMAHIMERYFTHQTDVGLTDGLCESLLKAIIKNALIVMEEPENYNARAELMWAGTLAHNGIVGTGRIGDWASHAIEHELSALYDVAHGAGLAVVFPAWMLYVYKHNINRFAQFAVNVFNVDYDYASPEKTALEGIRQLKKFFQRIGMPTSLKELNIPTDSLEEMARKCKRPNQGKLGYFLPLTEEDILAIYRLCL